MCEKERALACLQNEKKPVRRQRSQKEEGMDEESGPGLSWDYRRLPFTRKRKVWVSGHSEAIRTRGPSSQSPWVTRTAPPGAGPAELWTPEATQEPPPHPPQDPGVWKKSAIVNSSREAFEWVRFSKLTFAGLAATWNFESSSSHVIPQTPSVPLRSTWLTNMGKKTVYNVLL